jgi:cytosine/adenosine deaminase-related metal-dependent hydrolase
MFTEMRLSALVHKLQAGASALPAAQVLEMATLAGARALGLEGEIGSVEEGKRADLTVVNLSRLHSNPASGDVVGQLIYSAHSSDVDSVIIEGRLVMNNRELLTLDEQRVLTVAREQTRKLMARLA